MTNTPTHHWIVGGSRSDRDEAGAALGLGQPITPALDAHRRLRGPYTAAGTLLRAIVPATMVTDADLTGRHDIEILAAAPELRQIMPMARETLTSSASVRERTRFYPADRTAQLAHGMTEFLRDVLARGDQPATIVFENLDHADPTDAELVAIMVRRLDPAVITVVARSASSDVEPVLAEALARYAHRLDLEPKTAEPTSDTAGVEELAARFVRSECLSADPTLQAAYAAVPAGVRAALHDARADELATRDEISLQLGAIPYHRERGSDPTGSGVEALRFVIDHCSLMGYYHATADAALRARPLVDWDRSKLCHLVTARRALALIMLGETAEVEGLYNEARLFTVEPEMHMTAAYSTAMLYTRHHEPAKIDHLTAKAWINQAIAFASLYPTSAERAFHTVFMENGLALIESRRGNFEEALRLVAEGAARLDQELLPREHLLHRSVLIHNSGQVKAAAGRLDDAIADFTEAIAQDPHYAPYHFDRAGLLHRLGRDAEAVADYETAMRMSPPLPEAHYNRGDIRAESGDYDGALADFDYALELNPAFLGAYVYRAGILADLGEVDAAAADVAAGLAIDPSNPYLLGIRGQLAEAAGDVRSALADYDAAIAADPSVTATWARRASLAFEQGNVDSAIADLESALQFDDSAALRFNRAAAFMAASRFDEALEDLDRALELDPSDEDTAAERERCLARLAARD